MEKNDNEKTTGKAGKPVIYPFDVKQDMPLVREPAIAYGKKQLTIKEYLEWEETNVEKYEYYQGRVFAMASPKVPHNIISVNLLTSLKIQLKGRPCRPYNSDQRIHIPANTLFTYPDISIVCGEPVTLNDDNWNVLNPSVLIEVLSPSTRRYDRVEKFRLYRDIPTLKEYLLVDSQAVGIEAWRIDGQGEWTMERYKDIAGTLFLPALGLHIPLTDIYEDTKLIALDLTFSLPLASSC